MNIAPEEMLREIDRLLEENKDLTRMCEIYSKSLYNADLKKAEDRIDKAIEYINEMTLTSDGYANYGDDLKPEHIIEILRGSEQE